jgi:hypothetical protein
LKLKSYYKKQWTEYAEVQERGGGDLLSCLGIGLYFMQIKAFGKTPEIYWPGQEKVHAGEWAVC